MKLFFQLFILIGLFKSYLGQTKGELREARATTVDYLSSTAESEGTKDAKCDPQSIADLVFAKLKIELDKQTAVINQMNGHLYQLKDQISTIVLNFNSSITQVIYDIKERQRVTEATIVYELEKTAKIVLELKENVLDTIITNDSKSTAESTETIRTQNMMEEMVTQVEVIRSQLEPFEKTLTAVDANVVKLSNALKSGESETHSLLQKVLKESAAERLAPRSEDEFSLSEQKMKMFYEIAHGMSSNVSSESKILQELIYQNRNCDLSRNLVLSFLPNGQQYFFRTKGLTWHKTKDFCEQHGMTMATLDTKEEFEAVSSHEPFISYWVAANDIGKEPGKFHWTNGVEVDSSLPHTYDTFGEGKETCLLLQSKRWHDHPCDGFTNTICKRPAYCKLN